jgi:hypothetical protein
VHAQTQAGHAQTQADAAAAAALRESDVCARAREQQKKTVPVDYYMFLFLKFLAAVIPTVEYDFTLPMNL